jgi:hypothetical protein
MSKPKIKKRKTIDRYVLVDQIIERLHNSATIEETLKVSNILLKTDYSTKDFILKWLN